MTRREALDQHLEGCAHCERTKRSLAVTVARFAGSGFAAVLVAVGGAVVLPGLGSAESASAAVAPAAGASDQRPQPARPWARWLKRRFPLIGAAAGLIVLTTVAAVPLSVGSWSDSLQAPSDAFLHVGTSEANCVVTVSEQQNLVTFSARAAGRPCTIRYALEGKAIGRELLIATEHVFVASRPGRYTLTLSDGTETRTKAYRLER